MTNSVVSQSNPMECFNEAPQYARYCRPSIFAMNEITECSFITALLNEDIYTLTNSQAKFKNRNLFIGPSLRETNSVEDSTADLSSIHGTKRKVIYYSFAALCLPLQHRRLTDIQELCGNSAGTQSANRFILQDISSCFLMHCGAGNVTRFQDVVVRERDAIIDLICVDLILHEEARF